MSIKNKLIAPIIAGGVLLNGGEKVNAIGNFDKTYTKNQLIEVINSGDYVFKYEGGLSEKEIKNILTNIKYKKNIYSLVKLVIAKNIKKLLEEKNVDEQKQNLIISIETFKLFTTDLYLFNLDLEEKLYTNFYPVVNNYQKFFYENLGKYDRENGLFEELLSVYNIIEVLISKVDDKDTKFKLKNILDLYKESVDYLEKNITKIKNSKNDWLNKIKDKNIRKNVEVKLDYLIISLEELYNKLTHIKQGNIETKSNDDKKDKNNQKKDILKFYDNQRKYEI